MPENSNILKRDHWLDPVEILELPYHQNSSTSPYNQYLHCFWKLPHGTFLLDIHHKIYFAVASNNFPTLSAFATIIWSSCGSRLSSKFVCSSDHMCTDNLWCHQLKHSWPNKVFFVKIALIASSLINTPGTIPPSLLALIISKLSANLFIATS